MIVISMIVILLVATTVILIARAVALPRMKAAQQLDGIGQYGFRRPQAPVPSTEAGPAFAGLAAGLGAFMSTRFGGFKPEALRKELVAAGVYKLTPTALLGYRFLSVIAFGAAGALLGAGSVLGSVFMAIAFAAIGWLFPLRVLNAKRRKRLAEIDRRLPDLIDLLVVAVEAGSGLSASLSLATRKFDGPLAEELRLTLQEQRMGRSLQEALLGMLDRVDTPNMRSFVRSVTQGETLGVSIGTIMRNLAEEMRKRRRAMAQEQAQKAPVKMILPLVFLILPSFIATVLAPPLAQLIEQLS